MTSTELIDRRTLVQINATIIAGMLIFLTISDFNLNSSLRDSTFFFTVLGFASLIVSMMICFASGNKGTPYSDGKLAHVFN